MTGKFNDKVVLITGAGGGIGRATALAFAQEGAKLVLVDNVEANNDITLQQVLSTGGDAVTLCVNVTSSESCKAMVDLAIEQYGQLDIAFNNAGITGPNHLLPDYPEDGFDLVMDVNLKSIFLSMKHEIPVMKAAGGGIIINTASVASQVSAKMIAVYSASKHAVMGLTKGTALECIEDNIRINAICPGAVDTPMLDQAKEIPGMLEGLMNSHPIGRCATAKEIAGCVLFLASEDSAFMVGHGMMVDGGITLQ